MELQPILAALCTFFWIGEMGKVGNQKGGVVKKEDQRLLPQVNFKWRLVFNPCAVTCGGGYQRSKAMCMSGDDRGEDSECSGEKPTETIQTCGQQPCFTPRWIVFNYSECTVTCGTGTIPQIAKCYIKTGVDSKGRDTLIEVGERMCNKDNRPPLPPVQCSLLATCPQIVAKVDLASSTCSNPPCSDQKGSAEKSAVEFTVFIGVTSLSAFLIRIYFFDT
ncbi:A disintegrin and metalloproteinase with thrombospondin motifs 6-like [Cloeon dipterum]|uniref:A disintegrin and metalloproteinase with thrombospondin motifs 6-like n=1 Tax=Cloeon dipterum TaxID=197152 RepID=UPI0032201479